MFLALPEQQRPVKYKMYKCKMWIIPVCCQLSIWADASQSFTQRRHTQLWQGEHKEEGSSVQLLTSYL